MKLVETQTFLTSIQFLVLPNYFWQTSPSSFDIVAWYKPSAQISHLDLIFKREIRFDLNLAFATNNSIWTRYVLLQSSYFEFATNVVLFLFWIVTNIKFQLDLVKLVLGKAKSEWPVAPGNTSIWWWWGCSIEMRWGWLQWRQLSGRRPSSILPNMMMMTMIMAITMMTPSMPMPTYVKEAPCLFLHIAQLRAASTIPPPITNRTAPWIISM